MNEKDALFGYREFKKEDVLKLRDIALYLHGVKDGKGNILPLGTDHLESLYSAIYFLNKEIK